MLPLKKNHHHHYYRKKKTKGTDFQDVAVTDLDPLKFNLKIPSAPLPGNQRFSFLLAQINPVNRHRSLNKPKHLPFSLQWSQVQSVKGLTLNCSCFKRQTGTKLT